MDFFDELSRNVNVFDPRNAINRGVTQMWQNSPIGQGAMALQSGANRIGSAIGSGIDSILTTMEGGPIKADGQPITPAEFMQIIKNNHGLTQDQLQGLMAEAMPGNGRSGLTPQEVRDAVTRMVEGNKFDATGASADAELDRYLSDLRSSRDTELGAIDATTSRLERITTDPNQIRTDAEYGNILRDAERALQASQQAARVQGANISATRGSGFSGAGLGLARAADTNAVNENTRIRGNALSDVNRRYYGDASNPGGIKSYRAGRATAYNTAESGAKEGNRLYHNSLIGQKQNLNPTFSRDQWTASIQPKLYAQSESERGVGQYLISPFTQLGDNLTAVVSNGANQIGPLLKNLG